MMIERIAAAIKRMNQLVLVFPVWIVLGVSGLFRSERREDGWTESSGSERYERMY